MFSRFNILNNAGMAAWTAGNFSTGIGGTINKLTGGFSVGIDTSGPNDLLVITYSDFIRGDVNADGVVSLLDVAPFVDAITNGQFIAEADLNCDGMVSLLDVTPFVALLSLVHHFKSENDPIPASPRDRS